MSVRGSMKTFFLKHPRMTSVLCPVINRLAGGNVIRIRGKDNKLSLRQALLFRSRIIISGDNNEIFVGNGSILYHTKITITGNNNRVRIGDHVTCKIGDFSFEDDGGLIEIGDRTTISGHTHLACIEGKSIRIGKDCLFSSDIIFRVGDSHSILDMDGKRINPSQDVEVGDHVWISFNSTLTKGSSVARDSIVGTGAIVTKKFTTPNVVLAGVPASIVKKDINWDPKRI